MGQGGGGPMMHRMAKLWYFGTRGAYSNAIQNFFKLLLTEFCHTVRHRHNRSLLCIFDTNSIIRVKLASSTQRVSLVIFSNNSISKIHVRCAFAIKSDKIWIFHWFRPLLDLFSASSLAFLLLTQSLWLSEIGSGGGGIRRRQRRGSDKAEEEPEIMWSLSNNQRLCQMKRPR